MSNPWYLKILLAHEFALLGILAMLLALVMIYCLLFATGYFIYGNLLISGILMFIALIAAYFLFRIWDRIKVKVF